MSRAMGRLLGVVGASGGLVALGLWRHVNWPIVAGVIVFLSGLLWALHQPWRRRRALAAPFPEAWRNTLERRVRFYRKLDGPGRRTFERNLTLLSVDYAFDAVRGATVDDEIRVLALAGGAVLIHHMAGVELPAVRDIVIYPDAFDDEYGVQSDARIAGMVHRRGPILFSSRALRRGWKSERDGHNVSIHEWAHVLDWADGFADGVPSFSVDPATWDPLVSEALKRVRARRSKLRAYGGTNRAELFAVAVEAFYEKPSALNKAHAELYDSLVSFFGFDPLS